MWMHVDEDSPAMTAGIQNGDILHALDGQEVQSMEEYASVLQGLSKGTRTTGQCVPQESIRRIYRCRISSKGNCSVRDVTGKW